MQRIFFFALALFIVSCGSNKNLVEAPVEYEYEVLDTLVVSSDNVEEVEVEDEILFLPKYNPEATRTYDLLHTRLDLAFDWEKQHVIGQATLDLTPLFYSIDEVILDAKQFMINKVSLGKNGKGLRYDYNDLQILIALDKVYKRGEKIQLYIDYVARPNEGPIGGSSAITSDKGLFFINPMKTDPNKPRQIWTQGETENNSKWFPTFDKPNERCTQEIYLTVANDLMTLSNGELVSSISNPNGTRTDYWKMDKPHAPYLFMLAIGEFARVKDSWNGKLLEYMVDPPYEADAKEIFNHTPEMLTFFSDILDYPYPWNKYSQVIAEDYVSGAMENTTGVIFGDFVQKTKRELIDNENDQIVAHEMFHHWFGDLVTCESWSNLTLNEGFANYSEYLWYEHKYGKDAADAIRMSEMDGYFYMAGQSGTHPLIHYGYDDKEDMFDAHSYNKGGLVLHMLRNYVGDEAFFAALSKYLKDNEYTAVETAELRIAFEETVGQDMNWFFDQWYLDKGHPELEVSYTYENEGITMIVQQKQSADAHRTIFVLPLEAAVYDMNGNVTYHNVTIDARRDTVRIEGISTKPAVASLDGKCIMLGTIEEGHSVEEWEALLRYSPYHFDKRKAINKLPAEKVEPFAAQLLDDNHHIIRNKGIEYAPLELQEKVKMMITEDAHSSVRSNAIMTYEAMAGEAIIPIAEQVIKNEQAYPTVMAALEALYLHDEAKTITIAEGMMDDPSSAIVGKLAGIFASTGDAKYIDYIEGAIEQVDIYQLFNVFGKYSELILKQDRSIMMKKATQKQQMALEDGNMYKRYLATNLINSVKGKFSESLETETDADKKAQLTSDIEKLTLMIQEIKDAEENEMLKSRYGSF